MTLPILEEILQSLSLLSLEIIQGLESHFRKSKRDVSQYDPKIKQNKPSMGRSLIPPKEDRGQRTLKVELLHGLK